MKDNILLDVRFAPGDEVWLIIKTSPVNPGFVVVEATILDVVTCITDGESSYKMRLPDDTIAVEHGHKCFKNPSELAIRILKDIEKDILMLNRAKKACYEAAPHLLPDTDLDLEEKDETKET